VVGALCGGGVGGIRELGRWGEVRERENTNESGERTGTGVWGRQAHTVCGANSAGLRCEARFELLSSAWLRSLFWVRWAVLRSAEPGYQTLKSEKR
jgi:hypothetical protein